MEDEHLNTTNHQQLKLFNVNEVLKNNNFSMILYGLSRSGKSTFLSYLLKLIYKKYDFIIFFTHSENASVYNSMKNIKNLIILNNFHDDIIRMMYALNKKFINSFHILFVFDDYEAANSNMVKSLYTRGRNSNFSIINSVQYFAMIDKRNRSNVNYAAIFRANNSEYIKNMAPYLAGFIDYDKKIYNTRWKRDEYYENYLNSTCLNYKFIILDYLENIPYIFKTPL